MPGLLADKDRIFTNLYGLHDRGLEAARARGAWNGVDLMVEAGPQWIIEQIKASGLRGRGGGGFGVGLKWSLMPQASDKPHYLIINADESEPGACKDRLFIGNDPQLLVEGAFLASYAIGAHSAYVYIRGEVVRERELLEAAIREAREARLIGPLRTTPSAGISSSTSATAPAPISAATRWRCWRAWKAVRASPG